MQRTVDEITEEEVQKAIKELTNNKSPGLDRLGNELLKYAANVLKYPLSVLFNKCLNDTDVP